MYRRKANYYKSLLLLLAFGLHLLTGFACSVSPWLHQLHHAAQTVQPQCDDHTPPCHKQQKQTSQQESEEEDCCSATAALAQKAEKSISRTVDAPEVPLVTSLIPSFFQWQPSVDQAIAISPHIRWRQPGAPPDLCIVLSTFRI